MPVFTTKKLSPGFDLVRSYTWMTGDGEIGDNNINTSQVLAKDGGGSFGVALNYDESLTINRDAEELSKPSWMTLGFDGSSTMRGAILISEKLEPGQFIEISGYVFLGSKMDDANEVPNLDTDSLEIFHELDSNI